MCYVGGPVNAKCSGCPAVGGHEGQVMGRYKTDEDGVITEWCPAVEKWSGRRAKDVIGRRWYELSPTAAALYQQIVGDLVARRPICRSSPSVFFGGEIKAAIRPTAAGHEMWVIDTHETKRDPTWRTTKTLVLWVCAVSIALMILNWSGSRIDTIEELFHENADIIEEV